MRLRKLDSRLRGNDVTVFEDVKHRAPRKGAAPLRSHRTQKNFFKSIPAYIDATCAS